MDFHHWERLAGKGLDFSELGFGTAPLGNLYKAVSDEEARATLDAAWETGCRYYDTAPLYGLGLSETRLNFFLRGKNRDDYVLSTKVGRLLEVCEPDTRTGIGKFFDTPNRREIYDYTHDGVMRSVEMSLERLGVDRIDILFAHDLDIFNHGLQERLDIKLNELMESGYRALLSLRDQGVISAFGAGINEWQPAQWMAERGDFDIFLLAGATLCWNRKRSRVSCPCAKAAVSALYWADHTIPAYWPPARCQAHSTITTRRRGTFSIVRAKSTPFAADMRSN